MVLIGTLSGVYFVKNGGMWFGFELIGFKLKKVNVVGYGRNKTGPVGVL